MVLMDSEEVEERSLIIGWAVKCDMFVSECSEKTLIPYITDAVKRELGLSFLEQYRLDVNVVGFRVLAKVVHQASHLEKIEGAEVTLTARVVVVAMDGENWKADIHVWVFIIDT